jgi:hypothetical protein
MEPIHTRYLDISLPSLVSTQRACVSGLSSSDTRRSFSSLSTRVITGSGDPLASARLTQF